MPPIHPAIYPKVEEKLALLKNNTKQIDQQTSERETFLQELNQFSTLIDHNILDNFLSKQKKQESQDYCKAHIEPSNPSLSAIIKKNRHIWN